MSLPSPRRVVTEERREERLIPEEALAERVYIERPRVIQHYNDSTKETANEEKLVTFYSEVIWITIDNMDDTDQLEVSFDKGKTYKTIRRGGDLRLEPWATPKGLTEIYIRSPASSTPYQILTGER